MTPTARHRLVTDRQQQGPVQIPDDATPRLPKLQGIRAVVFDVYGTLFSSGVGDISLATEEDRDAAIRATLRDQGIDILPSAAGIRFDDALHAVIHSHQDARRSQGIEYPEVDIRDCWRELIKDLGDTHHIAVPAELDIDTLAVDYETRVNPTQPMPKLKEVLQTLHQRGIFLNIISNAQFYTPLLFEAFLGQTITELGFSDRANVWSYAELEGKPSKALYQYAAERLRQEHFLHPEQCLYIGNDMRNDIWPAQSLGFRTALFAGDRLSLRRRSDHPRLRDLQPDCEITTLEQIFEVI